MKANEGSGCIRSHFTTSALDVPVRKTARLGCFTPAKCPGKYLIGNWLGARDFGRVPRNLLALVCLELHLPRPVAYTEYSVHCTCFIRAVIQKLNHWMSRRMRHSRLSNPNVRVYLENSTVLFIFKVTINYIEFP
jgi:hypothetical protein